VPHAVSGRESGGDQHCQPWADAQIDLAHRHDPGLEPDDIAEVGHHLDRLDDRLFARYGLDANQVAALRASLAVWPRPTRYR